MCRVILQLDCGEEGFGLKPSDSNFRGITRCYPGLLAYLPELHTNIYTIRSTPDRDVRNSRHKGQKDIPTNVRDAYTIMTYTRMVTLPDFRYLKTKISFLLNPAR